MASTQELWIQQNKAKQRQFSNEANLKYWEDRERTQRELYMKEEAQQQKEIEQIYQDMYSYCEQEINAFYGKYASAEGIDITEAKKRVTSLDIEEYERLAKKYVKEKDFSPQANAEMRLYNATMKINRLEMLKARIGVHIIDGINTLDEYYEKKITDRTRAEIERQAGILGETVTNADTTKRAKNIVNASFFNANFSERIWSHMDRLRSQISIELQRGLIAGVGSRKMAQNIKELAFDKSAKDAHRLMVTELRRVQTDVAMDAYKEGGVDRYIYMAVNPNACPICRKLNGKDFAVKDAQPADNAPPMHPRCHCTTAPWFDEGEYNAWLNYLEQGGSTSEWNKLSASEKQKYDNFMPNVSLNERQPAQPSVVQSNEDTWSRSDVEWSKIGARLKMGLEARGVEYRQAKKSLIQPSEAEIISKISGGDKTQGSCVSVALAYIANKCGLDVRDFRGGSGRELFAWHGWDYITMLNGIQATREDTDTIRPTKRLLATMQEGKEYLLSTGNHTSIVRLNNGKQQYLELQSETQNGWKDFEAEHITTSQTLKNRFGVRTASGESIIVDIEQYKDNDEFRDLMGYINTAEDKQKKGAGGGIK